MATAAILFFLVMLAPDLRPAWGQGGPHPEPRGLVRSFGNTGYRHFEPIEHACLDPGQRMLFTLSYRGIYVWDLDTGESHFVVRGERIRNALSISPNGTLIATIAGDGVVIWNVKTRTVVTEIDESSSASQVAFQPSGKGLITVCGNRIERRELDGKRVQIVGETAPFCRPALSADGKWLAASATAEPGELTIYNTETAQKRTSLRVAGMVFAQDANGLPMVGVAFSTDGKRLAVLTGEGSFAIWDLDAAKEIQRLRPSSAKRTRGETDFHSFLFSRDGKRLFAGTGAGTIRRWDVESGKELGAIRGHTDAVRSLHLVADGKQLISTSADGMIRRWDLVARHEIKPPPGYAGSLFAHLSPKGDSVLLLDASGRLDVWDLNLGRRRLALHAPNGTNLETPWVEPHFGFLSDAKRVFLADLAGKVSLWDAGGGELVHSFALDGFDARLHKTLRFCIGTPDGQAFVVNRDTRLRLIRADSGKSIWESAELTPRGQCFPPVITADGKSLFLGVTTFENRPYTELRGKLELVQVHVGDGKVVERIKLASTSKGDLGWLEQPRLTPDGRTLLISYTSVEQNLIDVASHKALHNLVLFLDHAALSADGNTLVGVDNNEICVFDATTGTKLRHLPTGNQTLNSLQILPDGRHVLTSGRGGRACLWDLTAALRVPE